MKRFIVITGASTGIGYAASKALIERGYHVFGSVRKDADGKRVQSELGPSFTPLLFDVTDHAALPAAVEQVRAVVGERGITLSGGQRPAMRIQADTRALASYGLTLDGIRTAITTCSRVRARSSSIRPSRST